MNKTLYILEYCSFCRRIEKGALGEYSTFFQCAVDYSGLRILPAVHIHINIGIDTGCIWATVKIHYGLNLQRITPQDIRSDGDVVLVRVPDPELFDLSVVPGSIGFLSKSSAVAKLQAFLHDGQREELEGRLRKRAMEFAVQNGMLPSRGEILRELNEAAKLLDTPGRQKLRFE